MLALCCIAPLLEQAIVHCNRTAPLDSRGFGSNNISQCTIACRRRSAGCRFWLLSALLLVGSTGCASSRCAAVGRRYVHASCTVQAAHGMLLSGCVRQASCDIKSWHTRLYRSLPHTSLRRTVLTLCSVHRGAAALVTGMLALVGFFSLGKLPCRGSVPAFLPRGSYEMPAERGWFQLRHSGWVCWVQVIASI